MAVTGEVVHYAACLCLIISLAVDGSSVSLTSDYVSVSAALVL